MQLKHAHIPHAHVYITYSRHLVMLNYYYLLTLMFADLLVDKVNWQRHAEPQNTCLETCRPNMD